jgi:hypothetical protein
MRNGSKVRRKFTKTAVKAREEFIRLNQALVIIARRVMSSKVIIA